MQAWPRSSERAALSCARGIMSTEPTRTNASAALDESETKPAEKAPFLLNAFTMNAASHTAYGLWRHPGDQHYRHAELAYWQEIGQLLDGSGFDNLFIADALSHLDTYGGNAAAALAHGVQTPITDPLLIASGIAAVTDRLGITVTVSTSYEHPWLLARKFTTLDHATGGRIG